MSVSNVEASQILSKFLESYSAQLFRGDNGMPCISIHARGKQITMVITSQQFTDWFISEVRKLKWVVSDILRGEVIDELVGLASENNQKVFVRVAKDNDSIQIDLNDASYDIVYIEGKNSGFTLRQPENTYFLRPTKQRPLPRPIKTTRDKFLSKFKALIPTDAEEWLLVLAHMLKSLDRDRGSYPILVLEGPQGSGKTLLSRRLKNLIDPAEGDSYGPPEKAEDIAVASVHSYYLVFDNVSGISPKIADVFCRMSTGSGYSTRKFYENFEEVFLKLHRPVIINGIDDPSNRPDFGERCVTIHLKAINETHRVAETELDKHFEADLPILLGGMYELMSDCMRILPTVQQSDLPRMTDYARIGIAIEKVLKLKSGTFLKVYEKNRNEQFDNAFWGDDLCCAIYEKLNKARDWRIEGAAHDLMKTLFKGALGKHNAPRSAKAFSGGLKRIEPLLKTKGILVERQQRTSNKRNIVIRLESPPENLKSENVGAEHDHEF